MVPSINYDYPSSVLYSWKLEGFYEGWGKPGNESTVRYTSLVPGKYVLRVRAVSNEDQRVMSEGRSTDTIIVQLFWLIPWAMILHAILISPIAVITLRVLILKK